MSYDMVYDQHGVHYSQAGTFFGYGGPCIEKFTEQKKSGAIHDRNFFGCTENGERHSYRNLMEGSPYRIAAYIDGIPYQVSDYDPFDGTWEEPFDIQFMGEAKYVESDIFGIPNSKQLFTAMGVQRFDNDQLVTTCGNAYLGRFHGTPSRYAEDSVNCSYVRTWTK